MVFGYIVLTSAYYANLYDGKDILWMSTSLFNNNGSTYDQNAVLTPEYTLNQTAIATVGLPRYTTTYVISQMTYNLSLGAAITHVFLYNWKDLKAGKRSLLHLRGPAGLRSVCKRAAVGR